MCIQAVIIHLELSAHINVMINVSAIVTVVSLAISHKELKSSCDTDETIARDARGAGEERKRWSHSLSAISVVVVHMFHQYRKYDTICMCASRAEVATAATTTQFPFGVANASESGTVAECKVAAR